MGNSFTLSIVGGRIFLPTLPRSGLVQDFLYSTTHLVPEFTAVTDRGPTIERAKITFTKYGHDGVAVEYRVNGGIWVEIGIAMVKPWYDECELETPNNAEVREYRLRWWDKGFAHEDYSPLQRVTIGP
jgi:hypothetical protein